MTQPSFFPALNPGENVLKEFVVAAGDVRRRTTGLFLLIAVAFGAIAALFLHTTLFSAVLISCGLGVFVLAALPRTRSAFRLTDKAVYLADLTGDALHLHALVPILGAAGFLAVMVGSMPAAYFAYVGFACAALLVAARTLFPRRKPLHTHSLRWEEIAAVTTETGRGAMLLSPPKEANAHSRGLLVFCPKGEYESLRAMVVERAPGAVVQEGTIVR